ncbi:MAG: hypothetical protein GX122_06425 [Candidatus Cloacimonetes bacterium]|nr:hypothetical protein [Candidatus Cloacimonadota bacterium]
MMKKSFLTLVALMMTVMMFATAYQIGSGRFSTAAFPFNGLYDYSWSRMIYTSEQINTAGLVGPSEI